MVIKETQLKGTRWLKLNTFRGTYLLNSCKLAECHPSSSQDLRPADLSASNGEFFTWRISVKKLPPPSQNSLTNEGSI